MNKKHLVFAAAVLGLASCNQAPEGELKLRKDNIDQIVKALTLEEKCHLVIGHGQKDALDSADMQTIGLCKEIVPGCAGISYPVERLGIPSVVLADGPAGLRIKPLRDGDEETYYCTGFPIGTLLAASWDPSLAEQVGEAMGNEVLEYGVDVLLAPGANIHRNPLNGRNFEYFSEDPLLSGITAAAVINGVQENGVGTSLKHFAANNSETNRLHVDSRISQRALREIYLRNWQVALSKSEPWTVMTSYNYLNGLYTSENRELLQTVLRDEFGFKGMVMSDWGGGQRPIEQIKAGNDMIQPGKGWMYTTLLEAVRNGELAEADLDACVKRILELVVKTPRFNGYEFSNKPDLEAHAQVVREAASEGFVLLKNQDGALPFAEGADVAMFGISSYRLLAGGWGSGDVNKAYTVNLDEGLRNAGVKLDEALDAAYLEYAAAELPRIDELNKTVDFCGYHYIPEEMDPAKLEKLAAAASKTASQAVITITRNSGEGTDRKLVNDFCLRETEQKMIAAVSEAFHAEGKKVTVVLNIAGVIETASWKDSVDAILVAWLPGQEAGNSIADVLTGAVNPSGRLPMTFPESYAAVPSQNFPILPELTTKNESRIRKSVEKLYEVKDIDYIDYTEDIYVGYRHFCTCCTTPSYPFGFGLSYTKFEIETTKVAKTRKGWSIKVSVANVGENPGRDVIQLYSFGNPACPVPTPQRELKGFAKTSVLEPGQSEVVTIELDAMDLASFDESASEWVLSKGMYALAVTADAVDYGMSFGVEVKKEQRRSVPAVLLPMTENKIVPDGQVFIDAK